MNLVYVICLASIPAVIMILIGVLGPTRKNENKEGSRYPSSLDRTWTKNND